MPENAGCREHLDPHAVLERAQLSRAAPPARRRPAATRELEQQVAAESVDADVPQHRASAGGDRDVRAAEVDGVAVATDHDLHHVGDSSRPGCSSSCASVAIRMAGSARMPATSVETARASSSVRHPAG
jgi:hypothetical protein